jgi:group I intron endonuclease
MIGIYKILSPSNKIYIGQSTNIENRWKYFYKTLKCKSQPKLYNSLKKYGFEQHKFEIIEECLVEQLDEREIYWGTYHNVLKEGLNCRLGKGRGACSEETKQKMSKAHLGKKDTNSTKIKKSNSLKGKPKPKGFGENHSKLLKGITKPEGFGDKLSKIKMGTHLSLETRNKIGKSKTNHKCYSDPKRGEKIRESKNKSVLQYDLNNNFIKEFESGQQASKHTLIDARGISLCCRKKGKTAGGFKWKFKYL